VDHLAESYVKLALAMGRHDPDFVDAYYGPEEWRQQVDAEQPSLDRIREDARTLAAELDGDEEAGSGERAGYLRQQLTALITRADMLSGTTLSFDDESLGLFGVVAPSHPESYYAESLAELDALLPGTGSVADRYAAFTAEYVVPNERLPELFQMAIAESRSRTAARIALPEGEGFDLEFVTGYSWGGQNWYQGDYRSRILVNTDVPQRVDRVLDIAAHEGYPGHHVAALVFDMDFVRERGWTEFTLFPLYCPLALTAEGTAMLAAEVAFPGTERLDYEREVVYPAAGLDPGGAERYEQVRRLVERLGYAVNEAARGYLDGAMTADEVKEWLTSYALASPEYAAARLKFIEQYRSYVINYNVGLDLVRDYLTARGGTADQPDLRWRLYEELLRSPGSALTSR
jgi:hypothetical protein